jgi:hypothetical protein
VFDAPQRLWSLPTIGMLRKRYHPRRSTTNRAIDIMATWIHDSFQILRKFAELPYVKYELVLSIYLVRAHAKALGLITR